MVWGGSQQHRPLDVAAPKCSLPEMSFLVHEAAVREQDACSIFFDFRDLEMVQGLICVLDRFKQKRQ